MKLNWFSTEFPKALDFHGKSFVQILTRGFFNECPSRPPTSGSSSFTGMNYAVVLELIITEPHCYYFSDKVMVLPGAVTDYAIQESAIPYMDLAVITVGMIATWNPSNVKPKGTQCLLSYAVPGSHNKLTICTNPTLEFHIHMIKRFVSALSYCNFTSVK